MASAGAACWPSQTLEVAAGELNNFLFASLFMFVLVMAFNLFSDALQDALDPRAA